MLTKKTHYDVVVAGARVAGAATAMLLARSGLDVLVVDPAARGRDTLSTHAIMRAGVLQLARWGLLDAVRSAGTPTIKTTSFHYGRDRITIAIKPKDGVDGLYAPRRTILDRILGDAAEQDGVEMVRGVRVADVLFNADGRAVGTVLTDAQGRTTTVRAALVIGADGARSLVARSVGAETLTELGSATASIYGYFPTDHDSGYQWHYEPGLSCGRIPTNGGVSCVFASLKPTDFMARRGQGLESLFLEVVEAVMPTQLDRLRSTTPGPKLRAFAGMPSVLRQSAGPGWALVGDAGYFKDPLTAHGITDALRDAEILARAIISCDRTPAALDEATVAYQACRDALSLPLMEVTAQVAALDWSLEQIKALHSELSVTMRAEVEHIRDWELVPTIAT